MISLNFRTDLPKIRAAFEAKHLQAQHPSVSNFCPLYAGPCAIGVLLPDHIAALWDINRDSIETLFRQNQAACPVEQLDDWDRLQSIHDRWMLFGEENEKHRDEFVALLTELEAKYA